MQCRPNVWNVLWCGNLLLNKLTLNTLLLSFHIDTQYFIRANRLTKSHQSLTYENSFSTKKKK